MGYRWPYRNLAVDLAFLGTQKTPGKGGNFT